MGYGIYDYKAHWKKNKGQPIPGTVDWTYLYGVSQYNKEYDIKEIGSIDVSYYKNFFAKNKQFWGVHKSYVRSKFLGPAFKKIDTLPLLMCPQSLTVKNPPFYQGAKSPYYDDVWHESIFNELNKILTRTFGRGFFLSVFFHNTKPNGLSELHTDVGSDAALYNHRIHIPIKTNKRITFTAGLDTIHMKEGSVYAIDNSKLHGSYNASKTNRIHLVVDWSVYER
jgi:hypothetical protein